MAAPNLIIVPPANTRASSSKADKTILDAMVAQITPEAWVSDAKTYKTYKLATNASGLYRRAIPKAKNVPAHTLKSKVWGTDKDGNIVTDREKTADWRFAFTLDPARQPRTRQARSS